MKVKLKMTAQQCEDRIKELEAKLDGSKSEFRSQLLRLIPSITHADIDDLLAKINEL